ncbi:MAG: hypothetical protein QW272_09530, partial [Candidatus Methanomethylicaceae archaeon]
MKLTENQIKAYLGVLKKGTDLETVPEEFSYSSILADIGGWILTRQGLKLGTRLIPRLIGGTAGGLVGGPIGATVGAIALDIGATFAWEWIESKIKGKEFALTDVTKEIIVPMVGFETGFRGWKLLKKAFPFFKDQALMRKSFKNFLDVTFSNLSASLSAAYAYKKVNKSETWPYGILLISTVPPALVGAGTIGRKLAKAFPHQEKVRNWIYETIYGMPKNVAKTAHDAVVGLSILSHSLKSILSRDYDEFIKSITDENSKKHLINLTASILSSYKQVSNEMKTNFIKKLFSQDAWKTNDPLHMQIYDFTNWLITQIDDTVKSELAKRGIDPIAHLAKGRVYQTAFSILPQESKDFFISLANKFKGTPLSYVSNPEWLNKADETWDLIWNKAYEWQFENILKNKLKNVLRGIKKGARKESEKLIQMIKNREDIDIIKDYIIALGVDTKKANRFADYLKEFYMYPERRKAEHYFYLTHSFFTKFGQRAEEISPIQLEEITHTLLSYPYVPPMYTFSNRILKPKWFHAPIHRAVWEFNKTQGEFLPTFRSGYTLLHAILHKYTVNDYFLEASKLFESLSGWTIKAKKWIGTELVQREVPVVTNKPIAGFVYIPVAVLKEGAVKTYYVLQDVAAMFNRLYALALSREDIAIAGTHGFFGNVNTLLKRISVAWSAIHYKALSTAHYGARGTDALDEIIKGIYNIFKYTPKQKGLTAFYADYQDKLRVIRDFILKYRPSLTISTQLELADITTIDNLKNWDNKVLNFLGLGSLWKNFWKVEQTASNALWHYFFNTLKIESAYQTIISKHLPLEKKIELLNTFGYLYGGNVDWYLMSLTERGQRNINFVRTLFFAPDWYLTLIRSVTGTLKAFEAFEAFYSRILTLHHLIANAINLHTIGMTNWELFETTKDPLDLFMVYYQQKTKSGATILKKGSIAGFEIEGLEWVGIVPFLHLTKYVSQGYDWPHAFVESIGEFTNMVLRKLASPWRAVTSLVWGFSTTDEK